MTIYLHDFTRSLSERAKSRKHVGPYQWTPATPGTGRGFYMGRELECARHGSGFRLRLESANAHISSRLSHTSGYYCDPDGFGGFDPGGDTLQPIIARLPHGRGFLAGWTMGAGMASSLDAYIWANETDAAYEAHRMAESDAEKNRDALEEELEDDE